METNPSVLNTSEITTKEHYMDILRLHLNKCEWNWRQLINNKIN